MSDRHPLPDFFLIGAPRCGTTNMYTYLKQHPEIYLSVLKEPHFFSTDLTSPPQAVVDEAGYHGLFSEVADEKRIGEGSVWYLESRRAPQAIHERSPSARILAMLRNPLAMAFSLHGLYLRTGNEEIADFDEALAAQEARARGERIPAESYFPEGLQYASVALYSEKLKRYFDVFGRERVKVVIFDDFVADPGRVMSEVFTFLDVDPDVAIELDPERAKMLIRPKVLQQLRTTDPVVRAKMRGGGRRHTVPRQTAMSAEARRSLADVFAPDVAALSELIGRDLGGWCR